MKRFVIGLIIFVIIAGLAVGAAFGVNALMRNRAGAVSNTDKDSGSFQLRGPGMMHHSPWGGGFFGFHRRGGMMGPWDRDGQNNDNP
jgi:hypothetical protein